MASKVEQLTEINESDCCGNGCANCILEFKPRIANKVDKTGKKNIILNYNKYKLISKTQYSPHLNDVLELHFACCDVAKSADYMLYIPVGHHIMMRMPSEEVVGKVATSFVLRPYSPYWVHATNIEFKILVNLKPDGLMTKHIKKMRQDDEIEFRGPIGCFEWNAIGLTSKQSIFIITQGVAIAPVLPLIEQVLTAEETESRIFYFGCFQDLNHILFRERLQDYNKYWNFKGRIYLSHQKCESTDCAKYGCTDKCEIFRRGLRYKEPVYARRLQAAELEDVWREVSNVTENSFILCGSRAFQERFAESIELMDKDNERLHIFKL